MATDLRQHCLGNPDLERALEAVTEVIREQIGFDGLEPSPVQYFSAFAGMLFGPDLEPSQIAAHLSFLVVILPSVPRNILQSRFYEISEAIVADLEHYGGDDADLATSALSCLGILLQAQAKSVWNRPQIIAIFNTLLAFTLDPRGRVHKRAQAALTSLINEGPPKVGEITITFWRRMLLDERYDHVNEQKRIGSLIINVARRLIISFSTSQLDSVVQLALDTVSAPIPQIHHIGWLFIDAITSNTESKPSASAIAQTVDVLFKNRPMLQDPEQTLLHIQVLAGCVVKLHALNPILSITILKPTIDSLVRDLSADDAAVIKASEIALIGLVDTCIDDKLIAEALHWTSLDEKHGNIPVLVGVVSSICSRGMQSRFRSAWISVLNVIQQLLDKLEKAALPLMGSVIRILYQMLHELKPADEGNEALTASLEQCLGSAIRAVSVVEFQNLLPGGDTMWQAITANPITAVDSESVSLLVSLYQTHAHHTQLTFFLDHILPAALASRKQASFLHEQGDSQHQSLGHFAYRLFSTLTTFMVMPDDFSSVFPKLAPQLGSVLGVKELPDDWIPIVCNALRIIDVDETGDTRHDARLRRFKDEADLDDAGSDDDEDKGVIESNVTKHVDQASIDVMAVFAKNFLPVLYNLIINPSIPNAHRTLVLQAISSYASIAPASLLRGFLASSIKGMLKITADGEATSELLYIRATLADLIATLVPVIETDDDSVLRVVWRAVKPQLSDSDSALQKRSYHIVEALCLHHHVWIKAHADDVVNALLVARESCHAASRKSRLRSINAFVPLSKDVHTMIQNVMVEILMYLKEPNRTVRQGAMSVLAEMAEWWADDDASRYDEFVRVVVAGLAGHSVQMMSATVNALTWLVFILGTDDKLSPEMSSELLETIIILFRQASTPLNRAVLSFIKVCTNPDIVPTTVFQQHLPSLIPNLLSLTVKSKVSFRLQVRVILERVLRRFDYESLLELFPEDGKRFLANIHKEMVRKQRKKNEKKDDDHDAHVHDTVIRDDAGNVDLMDPSAARHMVSVDAAERARKRGREDSDDEFINEHDDGTLELFEAPTDSEAEPMSEDEKPVKQDRDSGGAEAVGSGPARKFMSKKWWVKEKGKSKHKTRDGDARRSTVQPYAYIPLATAGRTSSRKNKKMMAEMSSVIEGAKRGARASRKGKRQRRR